MKHRILPLLLAVLAGAAALTACSQDKNAATADEAVNRVYPDGEGKYYEPPTETAAASTSKETVAATQETKSKNNESKKKALEKRKETEPTTIAVTVPSDNITDENINPNLSYIQRQVAALIKAQTLKSVSLSEKSLTLEIGESRELKIAYDPEDALIKSCSVKTSADCISASISGSTVKVTAKKAGTAVLTVTSFNGHKASCNITVKRPEKVITDDTALPHGELCTAANVSRWLDAVVKRLQSLGMTRNTSLSGAGTEISTADLPDNISFNTAQKALADKAESELKAQTDEQWESFEFNCVSEARDNGEYAVIIIINEKEPPQE